MRQDSPKNIFHPRYYPLSLPLLILSLVVLLSFHFFAWRPLQVEISGLHTDWQTSRKKVAELERLSQAQAELVLFREILPARSALPEIVGTLSHMAKQHRLVVPEMTYQNEVLKIQNLSRITISFGVRGSYANIRTFIRALETSDYFFIIEDLDLLKSGTVSNDPIFLKLQVALYLKESTKKQENLDS